MNPFTRRKSSTRYLVETLIRKVENMSQAVEALTTAVTELEADESAAATAFTALAAEIAKLKEGSISEAEVAALAEKAAAVGAALKAATPAA